jgi:hypothetical protein
MVEKLYGHYDHMALDQAGGYFIRHMMAMTSEDLRGKAEIAGELGYRDMLIDQLSTVTYNRHNQHPLHPLVDWRYEVECGNTEVGYDTWVKGQLGSDDACE